MLWSVSDPGVTFWQGEYRCWLGESVSAAPIQPEVPLVVSQDGLNLAPNDPGPDKSCKLFTAYSVCVISKYPYFTALRDCLSW